mgnify:CR=1 FL=1
MAAVTTTEAADIIPKFWLNEAITRFRANTIMTRLCRRDYENTTMAKGDTISIPKRGVVTAKSKVQGSPIVPDAPTNDKVDVTIDQHEYVSWSIEDHAKSKALDVGLRYLDDAIPVLAEKVEQDLLNLYAENALIVGTAGTDLTEDTILAARLAMNNQKAPMMNRHLIVSPKDETALLKVDRFTRFDALGEEGIIREATLGRLHGFTTYMSTLVPTIPGPPVTTHNLAFHPNAYVLVSRALAMPPQGAGVVMAMQADPVSGLIFRYTQGYSILDQAMIHTIDILYGVKAIDEDRLAVTLLS